MMTQEITVEDIERLFKADHPAWYDGAIRYHAEDFFCNMDDRIREPLRLYILEQKMTDFQYGEFSPSIIIALQNKCSYFQALLYMDSYIKDPRYGKALILRR